MIFSELYGAYYNTVASILKTVSDHTPTKDEVRDIIKKSAFGESMLTIPSALEEGRWQLMTPDGKSLLSHIPTMPLTLLEKCWLNAVASDPRVRLFTDKPSLFPDVEPLFHQEDILIFDQYEDGDPYDDEGYIQRFRLILEAVRNHLPLQIEMRNQKGRLSRLAILPERLEYSEKDDKFRLIGNEKRYGKRVVNLGRVTACSLSNEEISAFREVHTEEDNSSEQRTVEFQLWDERKALERVLLHFAHYRKEAEKLEDGHYRIRVTYDAQDEAEMVIRILSFGPMIRVESPRQFVNLIKQRLEEQKSCGL